MWYTLLFFLFIFLLFQYFTCDPLAHTHDGKKKRKSKWRYIYFGYYNAEYRIIEGKVCKGHNGEKMMRSKVGSKEHNARVENVVRWNYISCFFGVNRWLPSFTLTLSLSPSLSLSLSLFWDDAATTTDIINSLSFLCDMHADVSRPKIFE